MGKKGDCTVKAGSAKAKGSLFEREVGKNLSLWLTDGEQSNIFSRNVLSGGSFTITAKTGIETPNIPGDLMAASPLAFEFLSMFSIECKHRADVSVDVFLRDTKGTSFLSKTIKHTKEQAELHNLSWMVIAKQNRCDTMVFMDHNIGRQCVVNNALSTDLRYHILCNDKVFLTTLDQLVTVVPVEKFIRTMKTRQFRGAPAPQRIKPPLAGWDKNPQLKRATINKV